MMTDKILCLRHEFKYKIDQLQFDVLRKNLARILKPDPHMGAAGRYNVRSLYFDDFRNSAFWEKQAGIYSRDKYRIRIYNCSDAFIKFERKTKIHNYVLKESVRITKEEANRIIAGDVDFLANSQHKLLRDFYHKTRCDLMKPIAVVEYNRIAYFYPLGNVRITFDTELRMGLGTISLFDRGICTVSVFNERDVILEVKYDEVLPTFISGLFPDTIRPRSAIGKFVMCREQYMTVTGNPACCLKCRGSE
ncbi:MAG: polyphosphate polymerase domain-containing protein [Candidatus Bathyarchaeales archaeon]